MEAFAEIKEKFREIYARFDIYFNMFFKFVLVLVTLFVMKDRLGYYEELSNPLVIVIVSLFCSILPWGVITLIMALAVLINIYQISLLMTILLGLVFLIIGLLFFGFHPGGSALLILTPLMFALNVPFILPLVVGITGPMTSAICVALGILIYYLILYICGHPVQVQLTDFDELTSTIKLFFKAMVSNRTMMLFILIFFVTIVIVYIIRRLSIDYSWYIAIGAGTLVLLLLTVLGIRKLGMELDLVSAIVGIVVGALVSLLCTFFVFSLDYKKTERTQFEDDEYYYYVKAVPKLGKHHDD